MNSGKISQVGSPIEIFSKSKNAVVIRFIANYILNEAKEKTVNGKNFVEGKFLLPVKKGQGKVFVNFKKTNYRFE